jgi:RpiB/LacA/LacB family sugar-phosphate isomerase
MTLTYPVLHRAPDFVIPLAKAVAAGKVERGVAICGSGVGASVCANKVSGVRAGLLHDHFSAKQGVEDDHMNVICMGGRTVGPCVAWDPVETFLAAEYSQAERHLRRLAKVASLRRAGTEQAERDGHRSVSVGLSRSLSDDRSAVLSSRFPVSDVVLPPITRSPKRSYL